MNKKYVYNRSTNRHKCKKHKKEFECGCKGCHQEALEFIELRLMDLDEEIKSLKGSAKWHKKHGAYSPWGWS